MKSPSALPLPPATSQPDNPVRGMLIAFVGALILPGMDAVAKHLGEAGAMSPGMITFFRFAIQTAAAIPFLLIGGLSTFRPKRFWINFLRGVLLALASLMFFTAVKYMPLADAIAVFFVEPLILTILSFLVLRETVGWRRVIAVIVGFGGAVLVIQPSYSIFGPVSLLPLGTAALFSTYLLLNRVAGRSDSAMVMQFVAGLGGMCVLVMAVAVGEVAAVADLAFTMPQSASIWLLLLLMGTIGLTGHFLLVRAFQMAPASLLAPFQYVEIVSAAGLGLLFFNEFPTPSKWLGIAIIVGSGLYVFWREQKVKGEA